MDIAAELAKNDHRYLSDSESSSNDGEPALAFPKFLNLTKPIDPIAHIPERDRLQAKPRSAFATLELERPKSPWSIAKSFFAKYKFDTDDVLARCFEFDWKCSTLDRKIRDPQDKEAVKDFLRPKYGLFREAYKHLACVAPAGNTPSIGTNVLTELMLRCNEFVDYKLIKLSDVDLAFVATNASGNKHFPFRADLVINPERQIIRYQFFEIMISLALERF